MEQNFLEGDASLLLKNLTINKDALPDSDSDALRLTPEGYVPTVTVKPQPGFCVKSKTKDGEKVFINVCYCDECPLGQPISDEKLMKIATFAEAPDYRFPMSLGGRHDEADKDGNVCAVYDVALNTEFYKQACANEVTKKFIAKVLLQCVDDKYSLDLEGEGCLILKNRTLFGRIRPQQIQQRPVKKFPKKLIEDLESFPDDNKNVVEPGCSVEPKRPVIEEISSKQFTKRESSVALKPILRLHISMKEELIGEKKYIVGLVQTPVSSGSDLDLFVGEDRVLLRNKVKNITLLDYFLPLKLNPEDTDAEFDINEQVLKIKIGLRKET